MNNLHTVKQEVLLKLRNLCAHCSMQANFLHNCPIREIATKIESLRGIPLMVNSEFKGAINLQ